MKPLILLSILLGNAIAWVYSLPIFWYLLINVMIALILFKFYLFRKIRHTLQILQITTDEILANDTLPQMLSKVEKRIGQLLNCKPVFIFWKNDAVALDWKKGYYHFTLQANEIIEPTKPARITLVSIYGEPISFYYYPVILKGSYYGSMLIPLSRLQMVTKLTHWFLKQISLLLIDQFHQLQAKTEIEISVQQELQKKVAQDMHDGLAQKLFFLSAQLFSIKNELRPKITDVEFARMKKLNQHVDESLAEVRNYMLHLRNSAWQINLFQKIEHMLYSKSSHTGLNINLHTAGQAFNESNEVLKAIYHLVDESTTNVIKHANASKIDVILEVTPIQWSIKITDDGIGMNASQKKRKNDRLGLVGIEERIKQVGGFVSIRSDAGLGTELISVIPRIHNRERGSIIGV